jgi:hypothetical protein
MNKKGLRHEPKPTHTHLHCKYLCRFQFQICDPTTSQGRPFNCLKGYRIDIVVPLAISRVCAVIGTPTSPFISTSTSILLLLLPLLLSPLQLPQPTFLADLLSWPKTAVVPSPVCPYHSHYHPLIKNLLGRFFLIPSNNSTERVPFFREPTSRHISCI